MFLGDNEGTRESAFGRQLAYGHRQVDANANSFRLGVGLTACHDGFAAEKMVAGSSQRLF